MRACQCPPEEVCAWQWHWGTVYPDQNFAAWDAYKEWLMVALLESKH